MRSGWTTAWRQVLPVNHLHSGHHDVVCLIDGAQNMRRLFHEHVLAMLDAARGDTAFCINL